MVISSGFRVISFGDFGDFSFEQAQPPTFHWLFLSFPKSETGLRCLQLKSDGPARKEG